MSKQYRYKLTLFGGFQMTDSENNPVDPGPRKARALLAWLAVNPDTEHPREKIAALLWPDSEEEQARHSLRQALGSLRKALPDAVSPLRASKNWVSLDSTLIKVDVLKFESAIDAGGDKASSKAGKLYKGEFLAGCNPRADLFEDWVMDYRHHYRERATAAMCRKLSELVDTGAYKKAVPVAMQLINIDPLRESAYRGLMMAQLGLGNHALALRWYRRLEKLLLSELNILPCLETRALYAQLVSERDASKLDAKRQDASKERIKQSQNLMARRKQRVLYQAGAAMEAIVDDIGGQSILIRGEAAEEKATILRDISTLAELQGFKVCHGVVSAMLEDAHKSDQAELPTHISGCLAVPHNGSNDLPTLTTAVSPCGNLQLEDNIEACIDSIKAASKATPLLLTLDNIHAAGIQILKMLARLITTAGESSILLVMTTRFGDQALDSVWQGAMFNAPLTTIDLSA